MKTVAGIDFGTQSIKVVIYDYEAKKIVAKKACPLELISDNNGTREQKTEWYDHAMKVCFDGINANIRNSIQAVGVSGQQHGFVPLDKDGNTLYNIKLWNDTSTVEECALITKAMGGDKAVIAELNNLMMPGFTAPKIMWLKRHKPDLFAKLAYVMLPHDYINYKLTGAYVMEAGDASGTALFNSKDRIWSKKVCDIIDAGLYNKLPRIIDANAFCGTVSAAAAAEYGIKKGIPVSAGGGDNMMGAIGTGTVQDGFLTMSLGTSGTLYGYSDKPIADPENGLSGFCASSGGWLPLLCTMNCTVATEQIRALFELEVQDFDALAAQSEPGACGVTVLPFFNGERTPNLPNGRASITGMTIANANRSNISRAAMESAIFAMRGGLDAFRALGFIPREIRLIGGGAKSSLWRQIAADILNLPVKVPALDEAAAMGAAIQALWSLNGGSISDLTAEHVCMNEEATTQPAAANIEAYNNAYAVYKKNLEAVMPLYK